MFIGLGYASGIESVKPYNSLFFNVLLLRDLGGGFPVQQGCFWKLLNANLLKKFCNPEYFTDPVGFP